MGIMNSSKTKKKVLFWGTSAALWLVTGSLLIGEQMRGVKVSQDDFREEVERQAAADLTKIKDDVADAAVEQYRMVARSGSAMDRCVQAGMVTAAFLQSQNNSEYIRWKGYENQDCKQAGLDR